MHEFQSGTKKTKDKVSPARRFAKDEDGGVFTVFVLLGFLVILATAGIGVDVMNYERDRANLQSTLDRAVLAAADLDQKLPPKDVVIDYLAKAGLQDKLIEDPEVYEGIGSRRVTAKAATVVNTHFMYFSGIPTLTAAAESTAEESIGSVEISLVLDMSGSMNKDSAEAGKTKIQVLREAAKNFVTTMLNKENPDKISISLIPYATQVNAGENILGKFTNVTAEHNYSHCVNFEYSHFQDAHLNPATVLDRTAHFDRYKTKYNSDMWEENRYPTCAIRPGSEITPLTNDIDLLHSQIDALTAQGNTSIDIGVKWGAALLDPQFRDLVGQLASQKFDPDGPDTIDGEPAPTVVPSVFSARPMDYDSEVVKVLIVMTDGKNTSQYHLKSSLRDGNSDVWYNSEYKQWNDDDSEWDYGEYSVRISSEPPRYWWTRQEVERDHRYGDNESEPGEAVRLTYPELFNMVSLRWNALWNYEWQDNNTYNWYSNAYYSLGSSSKDTRTDVICEATKGKGVIVYGIAFEAPEHGLNTIADCASSPSKVYAVNSEGTLDGSVGEQPITLEQAFESIASSIRKLRLTQ
ncbi:TadE/TadG family type IV pilus assembly protein [Ruegeria lacuscaerulensis]|uniref:TadE/TadG family type IV pilus assembly protein n=1 Tax=Ruegeria lacuscaerulensis TaxID=55218 RepID=UPI001F2ED796|nr:TadE/TadG family type IV pilus assembly protein [Ruegeria lacuscaerulensis]